MAPQGTFARRAYFSAPKNLPKSKKSERLSIRLSLRRLNRLRQYATAQDKTITQVVSDWIDTLPVNSNFSKIDKFDKE
ncbi:MAG: hypothetical protein WBV73_12195 [Phormidium sp.]